MYRGKDSGSQRTSLEVFILALISQGLTTTYALQSEAGLSLGATVPALKRLQDAGLVSKKVSGRRHEFTLTRTGEKVLRDWRPPSRRSGTDFDDLLRTAFLTVLLVRDRTAAAELLRQGSRARSRAAEDRTDDLRGTTIDPNHVDGVAYQWMRHILEQHRLAAESKALQLIASMLDSRNKRDVRNGRKRL
jgi:DNA-binding PadR family transcriptional regulator